MSKFKVGDKVKCVAGVDCFTANHGADCGVVSFVNSNGTLINIDGHTINWNVNKFELVKDEWSIYNNTIPLIELSDEQRGLLVNYWCNGGHAEFFDGDTWNDKGLSANIINRKSIYRAKQKSERELFIEAVSKVTGCSAASTINAANNLFDAGFKAPKVGE